MALAHAQHYDHGSDAANAVCAICYRVQTVTVQSFLAAATPPSAQEAVCYINTPSQHILESCRKFNATAVAIMQ